MITRRKLFHMLAAAPIAGVAGLAIGTGTVTAGGTFPTAAGRIDTSRLSVGFTVDEVCRIFDVPPHLIRRDLALDTDRFVEGLDRLASFRAKGRAI